MNLVDIVAILAVAQFVFFGILVGRARGKYGVNAPAVSGSEPFERIYRVQMNTLETLVALLPVLYIAARYCAATYVAAAGAIYIVGRFVYWQAYVNAPDRRSFGFLLTVVPIIVLALVGLVGAVLGRSVI